MTRRVDFIQEAIDDLLQIGQFVQHNDCPEAADELMVSLEKTALSLKNNPQRGHYPPELERIDVLSFREIHFKPYRIIYELDGQTVFVHAVLDGRRDIQSLLQQRLLR